MYKSYFNFKAQKIFFECDMRIVTALICHEKKEFRKIQGLQKSHGPLCMMSSCSNVFFFIGSVENQQGCMMLAEKGIFVKPQILNPLWEQNR